MHASWYDRQGPAADVFQVGELPDPQPGPGEVRVRVTVSGVNPGDTKKRRGWLGSSMAFPRVIPHSDAAGVADAVGEGVDATRVGQRVRVYGAQSYRAFGTAAQYTVVPDHLAVALPDHLSDELGVGLGIPGITAHRAVFGDGGDHLRPGRIRSHRQRNGACGFLIEDASPSLLIDAVRAAARGDADTRSVNGDSTSYVWWPWAAPTRGSATSCSVSLGTVKTHLANSKDELGIRNRVEIAAWAWDTGAVRGLRTPPETP
jgi:hypothetical protein